MERTKNNKKNTPPAATQTGLKKLKLLVTIVPRKKAEFYIEFLHAYEVNFQTTLLAQGTAKSETLFMLGLEDSDKSVILSAIREDKATEALHALEDRFHTIKNGKGIAFTIPLSSVVGVTAYRFLSNQA
jgi:uncharacterized protein YaaQ